MMEKKNGVLSIDALGLVHADLAGMRIDATLSPKISWWWWGAMERANPPCCTP